MYRLGLLAGQRRPNDLELDPSEDALPGEPADYGGAVTGLWPSASDRNPQGGTFKRLLSGRALPLSDDLSFGLAHVRLRDSGVRTDFDASFAADAVRACRFILRVQMKRFFRAAARTPPLARIAFFPHRPRPYYAIWQVCQFANLRIMRSPRDADLLFFFHDTSYEATPPRRPAPGTPVLNGACLDIRKSTVATAFEQVFGYPLALDAMRHRGNAVEKSEINGTHDGRVVNCPMRSPRPGFVYQRLIDNTEDGHLHTDIRTPMVGGQIPFVYLKHRYRHERFTNNNVRVDLVEATQALTAAEIESLGRLAKLVNMDFGSLDVLRDRQDGRIYVVDINKTDMGPPTLLPAPLKHQAMSRLADAFRALVAKRLA